MAGQQGGARQQRGQNPSDQAIADGETIEGYTLEPEREPDPAEDDAQAALSDFLADMGDAAGAKVTVYRKKEGRRRSWVTSFEPTQMDMAALFESLRRDYGGGEFQIQVRQHGRILKSEMVEIEPPPPEPENPTRELLDTFRQQFQPPQQQGGSEMSQMMMAMLERQEQQAQQFQQTLMQMMGQMFSAQQQQPQQTSMKEMVETIVALKGLDSNDSKEGGIEYLLKGIELARDMNSGDSNGFDLMRDAIKNFGGVLNQASEQLTGQQGGTMPQRLPQQPPQQTGAPQHGTEAPQNAPQNPTPETGASDTSTQENATQGAPSDEQQRFFEMVRAQVTQLCQIADNGGDPDVYAQVVIDQLGPDHAYAIFVEPQGRAQIEGTFADMAERREWFNGLADAIDFYTSPDDDSGESGDQGGGDVPESSPEQNADDGAADGSTAGTGGDSSHAPADGNAGERGEGSDAGQGEGARAGGGAAA